MTTRLTFALLLLTVWLAGAPAWAQLPASPPAEAPAATTGESEAVRASCVEFVLAGLHAGDFISRSERHGRIVYELP